MGIIKHKRFLFEQAGGSGARFKIGARLGLVVPQALLAFGAAVVGAMTGPSRIPPAQAVLMPAPMPAILSDADAI
jgi:hypothetical protein